MQFVRYSIKPRSPWGIPLRSDTLYGLICWHVAENEGKTACQNLIEAFREDEPPFLLSSAMPYDSLPMPLLPPISREKFRERAIMGIDDEKERQVRLFHTLQAYKKFRKQKELPLRLWLKHKDDFSSEKLFWDWQLENEIDENAADFRDIEKSHSISAFEPHVSINRTTGSAEDGQLFFSRLTYFNDKSQFHVYGKTDNPDWLEKYLGIIGEQGFGKDATIGKGRFSVERERDFQANELEGKNANAFMLLSVCASSNMEKTHGFYKMDVKNGKTGPIYANPFKKPFVMLKEGSVLTDLPDGPYVLENLSANPGVIQILQPLALPCRISGKDSGN